MKRVIVACANGVATSQAIASKINRLLKEKKVDAKVDAVNLKSLDMEIKNCVAYVTITKLSKEYPVPLVNGLAFLTGVNMDVELDKILKACQ